ncbi:MAG: ComF family protein [Proteobacteria bacterium]|nr:ComF family protein [Pseudomonadota bacterium]MCG2745064.1 ComF family protein [Desulfobacteraceae bacterium]MDO8946103.1 ComF family protein [Desulfocapsaceae bacterium]MBU3984315.1 ComF family protein [Pseudomonadota bacterium]MBU4030338.1 ComF family protein [Pseudomonadota bacterium]
MELIYPSRCYCCQSVFTRKGQVVCADCLARVHYLQSPLCSCCGREFPDSSGNDHLCGFCLRQPPVYGRAQGVVRYEDPVSHLLHRLKYTADTSTLPALAQVIKPFVHDLAQEFQPQNDRIVPVPLFPARLKKRGLNQSLLLARIFFPQAGDALLVDAMIRTRDTPPQTTLDGDARRKNLRAAFAVRYPAAVQGRRIFLVDDVFTTGTTVSECSRVLLAAGAVEICVVTVARVAG